MIPPNSPMNFGPARNGNGDEAFRGPLAPAGMFLPDGWGQGLAAAQAGSSAGGLNIIGVLKGVRRRWFLALSLGLLFGVTAAAAAWILFPPSKYVARTRLQVQPTQALLFADAHRGSGFTDFQRHHSALVKSRLVLNGALNEPKVKELPIIRRELEPVDWLEREVKVDFNISPNIMQISMTGDEPDQMVTLVNAIREVYVREIVNKEMNDRVKHLDTLKDYYGRYQNQVSEKRTTLKKLAEELGVTSSATAALRETLTEERLARAWRKLLDTQDELKALRASVSAQIDREKQAKPIQIPDSEIDRALAANESVRQQMDAVAKAEASYKAARSTTNDENAKFLDKPRSRVADAKEKLEEIKKELRPNVSKELQAGSGKQLQMSAAETQRQIDVYQQLETSMKDELDDLVKQTERLKRRSIDSLDMEFLKNEIGQAEALLTKIGHTKEALQIELPTPSGVQNLEEGVASRNQDDKKRLMATGVAGLAAFGLVVCCIGWLEFRARRIDTVDEVTSNLGMRIVGAIPGMPSRNWKSWVTNGDARNHYWRRLLTESVDAARTMLLHSAQADSLKVVMICSAVGGEGKTSLASHLSASLARAGRKTLLIDGDIRKPSLHKLFEAAHAPGISEYLRGEADLGSILQQTSVNGLHLIAAGQGDSIAVQALARDPIRNLLKSVREEFDFVLVDTSPVLPVADALLIAQHVDGVLFSILRDVSRFPKVYAAYQRLASLGTRILGAVVNGTRSESYGSDYYYYAGRVAATDSATE